MKTLKLYIYMMLLLVAGAGVTASCSSDSGDSLNINGQCMVESLTLNEYKATIDKVAQTVTVSVPEGTSVDDMQITDIVVSEGATASLKKGDHLNMSVPRAIIVKNGDVMLDWTLQVKAISARIEEFTVNGRNGVINDDDATITVYLPAGTDVSSLSPSITVGENADVNGNKQAADFTDARTYTVENNGMTRTYTVKVVLFSEAEAYYLGGAATAQDLAQEENAAYEWMLKYVPKTEYISLMDVANGKNLSSAKVIYWHAHKDGGVDGHDNFLRYVAPFVGIDAGQEPEDLKAQLKDKLFNKFKAYYENGGAFFLTRYAGNLASFIGATGDDTWTTPNNCWGQFEAEAELCGGPWTFKKFAGSDSHPLYAGLISGANSDEVYCTDAGYHITNSTSQYHIGSDWGGYDNHDAWKSRNGGNILGVGGDGAVVAWEYPARDGKGGIICIGSGCFDWYSYTYERDYKEYYHKNISIMAMNAINYLTK